MRAERLRTQGALRKSQKLSLEMKEKKKIAMMSGIVHIHKVKVHSQQSGIQSKRCFKFQASLAV